MQRNISNKIQLGDTLNPLQDYGNILAVGDERKLENLYSEVDKIRAFWKTGKADEDLSRYIPNILPVTGQNQIVGTIPRKAFTSVTYSGKKILEFVLELTANTYSNIRNIELVLPIQFTKKPQINQRKWMVIL